MLHTNSSLVVRSWEPGPPVASYQWGPIDLTFIIYPVDGILRFLKCLSLCQQPPMATVTIKILVSFSAAAKNGTQRLVVGVISFRYPQQPHMVYTILRNSASSRFILHLFYMYIFFFSQHFSLVFSRSINWYRLIIIHTAAVLLLALFCIINYCMQTIFVCKMA